MGAFRSIRKREIVITYDPLWIRPCLVLWYYGVAFVNFPIIYMYMFTKIRLFTGIFATHLKLARVDVFLVIYD